MTDSYSRAFDRVKVASVVYYAVDSVDEAGR